MAEGPLGLTELWALSQEVLLKSGYSQATSVELASGRGRLFEDRYGLVCVAVFQGWSDLIAQWPDVFGELVDVVSKQVPTTDAKAWEVYLVLLTPDLVPAGDEASAAAIRYDMRRVRKLLASGAELKSSADVERVLRPLLPLRPPGEPTDADSSVLDLLPGLLGTPQVPEGAVAAAVDAFKNGRAVITALDSWRSQQ